MALGSPCVDVDSLDAQPVPLALETASAGPWSVGGRLLRFGRSSVTLSPGTPGVETCGNYTEPDG